MSSGEKDYTKFPYKLTKFERQPSQTYLNLIASFREPAGEKLPGKVVSLTTVGSLGESLEGLQVMSDILSEYTTRWALSVNTTKAKIVVFRNGGRVSADKKWFYNDQEMEDVDRFTYRCVLLNYNGKYNVLQNKLSKQGVILGFGESTLKQSPNAFYVAGNVARGVGTVGGAFFFYAAGTHLSGAMLNLKEDHPNHIFGGLMAGIPIAARLRNPYIGMVYGAVFAFVALIGRYAARDGGFDGAIPNKIPFSREYSWRVNHYKYPMFKRPHEEGDNHEN